ncbi:MAG TPA: hypothetical protein VLH09_03455 [Bryobacteraceae bacterium]|nr:hypothetical protein [Bryobacteraceae bacterium]
MEKVINLLGGKPNGSPRTAVFDVPGLVRTLVTAMLTFGSLAFAAGTYFSGVKDLPARVDVVERKQDRVESQLPAILSELRSLGVDVRELRTALLADRRNNAR